MRILLRGILRGGLYLVAQEGLAIKFHPHFQPLHRDLGPGVDQKCVPWQRMAMLAMVAMALVVVVVGSSDMIFVTSSNNSASVKYFWI